MVSALVAIGANQPHGADTAAATCRKAVVALERCGAVLRCSRWYESPPDPPSDQPWYVNGVAALATELSPEALLAELHAIEAAFGRVRRARNAARTLDLDLIDYGGAVRDGPPPALPHPRLAGRAFVLLPLAEVAPTWRHPVTAEPIAALVADLPSGTVCRPLDDDRDAPVKP